MKTYPYSVWHTQGGGLVRRAGDYYVFVEAPDPSTHLKVGDTMPDEWGLAPANDLAVQEMTEAEGTGSFS
jgi:hypothetical protein